MWISMQNFETCGQWWEVKKTSLQVHFLPIQMVLSLTWPIDGVFFIPFNYVIVLVFNYI